MTTGPCRRRAGPQPPGYGPGMPDAGRRAAAGRAGRHPQAAERLRGGGVRRAVRQRRRDHRVPDPALHGDHDEPVPVHRRRDPGRRVHVRRRRARAAVGRVRRRVVRRAGLHRLLRGRRDLRLRDVLDHLRRPDPDPDVDRRPHPGPARRLRLRAHRRAVHPGHGLAAGLGGDPAGGLRQDPDRLRHRRGPAGAAAADGGAGRVLRLAHRRRGGDAVRGPGGRLPAARTGCRSRSTRAGRSRTGRRSTPRRGRRCSWSGPGRWRTRSRSSGRRPTSSPRRSGGTTRTSSRSTCSTTPRSRSSSPAATRSPAGPRSGCCASSGIKIGMARLMWIRPFPSEDLRAALRGVKAVGVVETNLGLGGSDLRRHPRPGRDHRSVPRGEPPAGDLVHGRARRRDRAGGRVRVDGRQARPGARARRRSRRPRTGSGSRMRQSGGRPRDTWNNRRPRHDLTRHKEPTDGQGSRSASTSR